MKTDNNKLQNSLLFSSRESLLKTNAELIENLKKRISVKRFRPQDGDNIKLGYIRALIQALQAQNAILKDTELDEFKKRLEALENSQTQGVSTIYSPIFETTEGDS
ncbi:hypothetical protein MSKOL_1832 [Methanosarcina sp. Kolksee]|uniref:hypothetical protein n=1 Tax=Methanosarcina sp. Kolksee TaxID=1434099 RepID=UPI000615AE98|nr:hypothetical protein [Methanosarcina sp. Kolksee]AKB47609.1 hypothetical protein MSKOL_1832 [Methanosarcina sp. Kolksee]